MISAYLSCSIKTAKRYHKRWGMPIRRAPGNMPIALKDELNEWLTLADEKKKRLARGG